MEDLKANEQLLSVHSFAEVQKLIKEA